MECPPISFASLLLSKAVSGTYAFVARAPPTPRLVHTYSSTQHTPAMPADDSMTAACNDTMIRCYIPSPLRLWYNTTRKYPPPPIGKFGGYKTEVKLIIKERERLALRSKVNEEKHLEIYGELKKDIGMKTHLHGPMDYAKNLKLRFRVGDLDIPERRKRHTCSREEEDVDAQVCPCGTAIESRTHIVGACEI